MSPKNDYEWLTPPLLWMKAEATMGGYIDLDPCAEPGGPPWNIRARTHYTLEDDGLAQNWFGSVFMNPPYGVGLIQPWCEKLYKEVTEGKVKKAVALLPARTETKWMRLFWRYPRCYLKKRVKFIGRSDHGPRWPSVVIGMGDIDVRLFAHNWQHMGGVYVYFDTALGAYAP